MKTNTTNSLQAELESANDSMQDTNAAIRAAYSESVNAGNEFAVIFLLEVISDAAKLERKIHSALAAAMSSK